jgi:hypothetical protein
MKNDGPQLGQLIDGDAFRDAVHVAVAPVAAAQDLQPGWHVGLHENGTALLSNKPIGIVDPFLTVGPKMGERFYLFLYPNTVTGMRHMWIHPAFAGKGSAK